MSEISTGTSGRGPLSYSNCTKRVISACRSAIEERREDTLRDLLSEFPADAPPDAAEIRSMLVQAVASAQSSVVASAQSSVVAFAPSPMLRVLLESGLIHRDNVRAAILDAEAILGSSNFLGIAIHSAVIRLVDQTDLDRLLCCVVDAALTTEEWDTTAVERVLGAPRRMGPFTQSWALLADVIKVQFDAGVDPEEGVAAKGLVLERVERPVRALAIVRAAGQQREACVQALAALLDSIGEEDFEYFETAFLKAAAAAVQNGCVRALRRLLRYILRHGAAPRASAFRDRLRALLPARLRDPFRCAIDRGHENVVRTLVTMGMFADDVALLDGALQAAVANPTRPIGIINVLVGAVRGHRDVLRRALCRAVEVNRFLPIALLESCSMFVVPADKLLTNGDEPATCLVCLEPIGPSAVRPRNCEHIYCARCLVSWYIRKTLQDGQGAANCPMCRSVIE